MIPNSPLFISTLIIVLFVFIPITTTAQHGSTLGHTANYTACRYLPGDDEWPTEEAWRTLNKTVRGNLIRAVPLAEPCYVPNLDSAACKQLQGAWINEAP